MVKVVKQTKINLLDLSVIGDTRGALVAIENDEKLPFLVKRIYYMYRTSPDVVRGLHAHKNLEQILITLNGSVEVSVESAEGKNSFRLESPNVGLHISGLVWRELMNFSPDAVVLVLASEHYDEDDYIRDYKEFKALLK